jgi:xylitol oxidase
VKEQSVVSPGVNWAGNIRYTARELLTPTTLAQLQEMVCTAERVRVLGSRHSFNDIADSPGVLLNLAELRQPVAIDPAAATATVGAGLRYGEVTPQLEAAGFALPNLGSLPHISVAGACATGTHGSGSGNRNLAAAVRSMEFVAADGELVRLDRDEHPAEFHGAVLGVGAVGPVVSLTLDLRPSFQVRQDVYLDLPYRELDAHFDEIMDAAYSVSLFLDFRSDTVGKVWMKRAVAPGEDWQPEPTWLGARLAESDQHPVPGQLPDSATPQRGDIGPWNERLPHFRLEFVPSSGLELQSEYLLPRGHAVRALAGLRPLSERIAPLLQVAEIRTVAADELWLSPAYQQDVVALHFTWVDDTPAVRALLPALEAVLDPLEGRPHWGKVFTTPPGRVRELYPRMADFVELVRRYDPDGRFGNTFLETYVY